MIVPAKEMQSAWVDLFTALQPFAYTVVHFNHTLYGDQSGKSGSCSAIAHAKKAIGNLAFRLDQCFFDEKFIQQRVSASDRFNAYCIVEKAGTSTHCNLLWYMPAVEVLERDAVYRSFVPSIFTRRSKLEFLLRMLNNSSTPMCERDMEFLKVSRFHTERGSSNDLARIISPWSVFTQSIRPTNNDIRRVGGYCVKECAIDPNFGDLVFDLRELHKVDQKQEPSRFWTISRDAPGRSELNLQNPVRFR